VSTGDIAADIDWPCAAGASPFRPGRAAVGGLTGFVGDPVGDLTMVCSRR
jgi:hypothetical protein